MRVTLGFLIALFVAASGLARADNPYAVVGISNPAHVTQFLARLKQAMAADDHAAVAAMLARRGSHVFLCRNHNTDLSLSVTDLVE
jgi:hypothetical protein